MWQGNYRQSRFLTAESLVFLIVLSMFLAACTSNSTPAQTNTTPHVGIANKQNTNQPPVALGVQPCPPAVSTTSYWNPMIPIQANINHVQNVICAHLLGEATLQALVLVRTEGTGQILDCYIYNNITNPNPDKLFVLQGLYKGIVKISAYNTILTGEVNQDSQQNKNQPNITQVIDLYREFKWSSEANTFVPVAFPGIFPDTSRYQAEVDQQLIDQGHQPWKHDAIMVAQAFASSEKLLQWKLDTPATLVSGGHTGDMDAIVKIKGTSPGGEIQVAMHRLEQKHNGIWIITQVSSNNLKIITPQNLDHVNSPVTIKGQGIAFEGKIGRIVILDSQYNQQGQADAVGQEGNGRTTFSTNVSYTNTFKNGVEDGIIALYMYSNADGTISGAAMIKTMLSHSGA